MTTLFEHAEAEQAKQTAILQAQAGSQDFCEVAYEILRKLAATSEQPPASQPMAAKDKRHGFEIERNFPKQTPAEQKATQQGIHEVVTKAIIGPP